MKLIILFLIFTTMARADYALLSEVEALNVTGISTTKASDLYVEIPKGFNAAYHRAVPQMMDGAPLYEAASSIVACSDPADCSTKLGAQTCDTSNGYYALINAGNTEVYCTKLVGYTQVSTGKKIVVEDATLKTAYLAAKALKTAQDGAMDFALRAISCGKRVIAALAVRNAPKGLTTAQVKTMNATYSVIKNLLETGSLDTAREEIVATVADGVLTTDADKTALISELDSCKP